MLDKFKPIIICFFLGLINTVSLAQNQILQNQDTVINLSEIPSNPQQISPISFEHLNSSHGLANEINKVVQTKDGYLWMGTVDGLFRYDGIGFKVFKQEIGKQEGLTHSWIFDIVEDAKGRLWVISKGNILHLYDNEAEQFRKVSLMLEGQSEAKTLSVSSVWGDTQGRIWIGTKDFGFNQLDLETGLLKRLDLGKGESINDITYIFEDNRGDLWLSSSQHLINLRFSDGAMQIQHFPEISTHIGTEIIQDKANNICLNLGMEYLLLLNPENRSIRRYRFDKRDLKAPDLDYIKALHQTKDGKFWIGRNLSGIRILDLEAETVRAIRHNRYDPNSLSLAGVIDIEEDESGGVWLATWGGGLNVYFPQKANFHHYYSIPFLENTLSHNSVRKCYEDSKGNVWIGTSNGLNVLDKQSQKIKRFFIPSSSQKTKLNEINGIAEIAEDGFYPKGHFWIGTLTGLYIFNPITEEFTKWESTIPSNQKLSKLYINFLHRDRKSRIWTTCSEGQLYYFDNNLGDFYQHPIVDSLAFSSNPAVIFDPQGRAWIWRYPSDIYCFDLTTETFETFQFESDEALKLLNASDPDCFWKDSKGQQWIGSYQGLFLLQPSSKDKTKYHWKRFSDKDGLPGVSIVGLLEDNQNHLWISSEGGLSKMDITTHTIKNYDIADGLQSNDFDFQSYYKSPSTGAFYFGGPNGFNFFHPDSIKIDTASPKVAITGVAVFRDKKMEALLPSIKNEVPNISLFYGDKLLQIDYAALHFTAPERNQYAIQLEGYDEEWRYVDNQHQATYTNLDPGYYVFRVKAANKDGVWNEQGAALKIVVYPPWWASWWAYSLYFIAIGLAIYFLYQFQLNRHKEKTEALRLKELDELKSRLYTNITHEFRTPLTIILGMIKQIKQNPKEHLKEGSKMIERNGRNLLGLVNQLLDLSKLENHNLKLDWQQSDVVSFLRYVSLSFQSYANMQNLSIQFFTNTNELVMDFDAERLQQVMTNLVSNAIKFTPSGGEIKVFLAKQDQLLELKVQDTGIGIASKELPHIFNRFYQADSSTIRKGEGTGIGLAHTKEVVKLMGGQISVESKLNKGSIFTILLPIQNKAELGRINESPVVPEVSRPIVDNAPNVINNNGQRHLPQLLIMEDNPDVVVYLKACLTEHYHLDIAYNGRVGIEKAMENIPDLIISDVMMPEKDGFEVCDTLKNDEKTSHIPIILLTAKADVASKIDGLRRGADAYLAKPFHQKELLVRLEMLMEQQKRLKAYFSKNVSSVLVAKTDLATPVIQNQDTSASELVVEPIGVEIENVFIQKVRKIVEENYAEEHFALPQLCQKIGMSRSQLYRKMKALIDVSPSKFIRSYRLAKAKMFLKNEDWTVSEVSWKVGFKDTAHFSKAFFEEFGVWPSEAK